MYVVQTLNEHTDGGADIELSVVKEGSHGHGESWGWPSDDKIILLEGTGYSHGVVEQVTELAQQLANELNERI